MSHSFNWKPCLMVAFCLFACRLVQPVNGQEVISTAERIAPPSTTTTGLKNEPRRGGRDLATPERSASSARQSYTEDRQKALTAEQKKFLAGSTEDQVKYVDFLKQSDTGLFRLLPGVDYKTSLTVSADAPERSLPIRGGGAYYSFGKKTHVLGPWSDLYLEGKVLFTEVASLSVGLFTALGDVSLEAVTLQSPGVDYLDKLTIPTLMSEASAFAKRNAAGFQEGDFHYRSAVQVLPNTTYILRSVGYRRPDFVIPIPGTAAIITSANIYQGGDVIVAFRIVRQEADGVLTLLWKRLKKSSAPELKRDKK
jgi:hypothetical protein